LLKKSTERIRQAISLEKDPHLVLRTPLSQTWERGGGEGFIVLKQAINTVVL
jgi:hypothetical protein